MKSELSANLELQAAATARADAFRALAPHHAARVRMLARQKAARARMAHKAGDILAAALVGGGLLFLALAYFDILAR